MYETQHLRGQAFQGRLSSQTPVYFPSSSTPPAMEVIFPDSRLWLSSMNGGRQNIVAAGLIMNQLHPYRSHAVLVEQYTLYCSNCITPKQSPSTK